MNRIFSGIRPSGKLHLGNYLGAIKNWIALQDKPDTERAIYAVVDLHGITTPYDPKTFHAGVMDVILDYLAAGIVPSEKTLLVRQSKIHQHAELAWLFNTITPVSWLERLPTYKEKMEQTGGKYQHMGLLDYPVLQAADILLYKSNLVPVGEDQKKHIDVANEIGKKFNSMFDNTFESIRVPTIEGAKIMSLKDPLKKMSKTGDEGIALADDPDAIREKIKRATTDSGSTISYDPEKRPAISNLLTIYHLLSDEGIHDIANEYEGRGYADFKNGLAEVVIEFLRPFQKRRARLTADMTEVENILQKSEQEARTIAEKTLSEVKTKMGL